MKKLYFMLGLILLLMIVGCGEEALEPAVGQGADETNQQEEENANDDNHESEEEENKEDKNEENAGSNDDEEVNEDKDNEAEQEEPEKEEVKEPQYKMNDVWYIKPIDKADPNAVLLTIDDAPDGHALEMAATLKEYNAPAIFFVNGIFMDSEEGKKVVKELYDMGFEIGNHTYSHKNLRDLSQEKQHEEIMSVSKLIEEVTGEKPKFFRAPHGANTDYARKLVKEQGMLLMNWSYGYDFMQGYMEKEALEEIMVNAPGLGKGANLLMHDREWTNAALPAILEGLKEKGYGFIDPDLIETPMDSME
ncbi:polysaccharide deacetylase family protein [Filobacillus milosensis]|uniref:Polysaccharide deacetylase family protein n=1 Tax=Filobacillus milosensis TaxID=94137 RepID=A0A4Y8IG89_9BACI|nr:polysaccharide deacetylase family protein [Filobacillus milosensis]TFB14041.1 polysaccharide deacetylase family protein [Filobacillus milosensis]